MKIVTAIIKPVKLPEVREALTAIGVRGMTLTKVEGWGQQKGNPYIADGLEYTARYVAKLKIEVAVDSRFASKVVDAIQRAARTSEIGDGKIFVTPLERAVRIRTGEMDTDAF
jgi:nitrogen regulatory protein P-II 2